MEPYIVPKDWLVGVGLLSVGAGFAAPLAQRPDWIGWVGVIATSLMAIPVAAFACYLLMKSTMENQSKR